jgi:ABC-type dipeptide/oligopeptide/nickel transport system ATPase subunit
MRTGRGDFAVIPAAQPAADHAVLLAAYDVSLGYHGVTVVRGVSLQVRPGEAVGVAGESGSGKSTLARALAGDLAPMHGSVLVNGRVWPKVRRSDPERRSVQMIFQDPYSALNPRMTARQALSETLHVVRGLSRRDAADEAGGMLTRVGLSGAAIDARPGRLSGGQRQRVVIARAIACEPDVLIADEPTSSLDVSIQAQILDLLIDLRTERGLALVLVTHDLAVLGHMTDTCLVMQAGRVVEEGPTEQILAHPQHSYTRALVGAHLGVSVAGSGPPPAPDEHGEA